MGFGFKQFVAGVRLIPVSSSGVSVKGDLEVLDSSGKLNYFNGTSASPVLTEAHSATVSNKTFDSSNSFPGGVFGTFADGTVSAPSITFTADLDTGFYRPGNNTLAVATGGVNALTLDSSQNANFAQRLFLTAGTAGLPTLSFPTSGLFQAAANSLGISTNGAEIARFDATSLKIGKTTVLAAGEEKVTVFGEYTSAPAGTIRGINSQARGNFDAPFTTSGVGVRAEFYRKASVSVTDTASAGIYGTFSINQVDLPALSTYTAPLYACYGTNILNNVNGSTINVTSAYGYLVNDNSTVLTGTKAGVAIGSLTGATRNVSVAINNIPTSGDWTIYSGNTNPSYFAGSLRQGTVNSISGFAENNSFLYTVSANPVTQVFGTYNRTNIDLATPITQPIFNSLHNVFRVSSGSVTDTGYFNALHTSMGISLPGAATYTYNNAFPLSPFRIDALVNVNGSTIVIPSYAGQFFNSDSTAITGTKAFLRFGALSGASIGSNYITDSTPTGDFFIYNGTSLSPSSFIGQIQLAQSAGATDAASLRFAEKDTTPNSPTAGTQIKMYMKSDKIIFQYNDGGTVRYKYLDMTGTGVTWVHTTVAP